MGLRTGRLLSALAVAGLAAALSGFATANEEKQPMLGETAPKFTLKSIDDRLVSLEQQRGKFVVLHFAASW
ncbi:MAG: hypothetical protein AB1898_08040 [Acidobacteriota bacterium]